MREGLRATGYLLVGSFIGLTWSTLLITLVVVGVSTIVLIVGVPLLVVTARLVRWVDAIELARAARYLRSGPPNPPTSAADGADPSHVSWIDQLRAAWSGDACQRALAGAARIITSPLVLSIVVVVWAVPLGMAATPILAATGLEPTEWTDRVDSWVAVDDWPAGIAMTLAGVALLVVAVLALRRLADAVARRWLGRTARSPRSAGAEPDVAAPVAG